MKKFEVYEVSVQMIRELGRVVEQIARRDDSLAKQTRRAAQSVVLCIAEGNKRVGRDRTHLFRIAAGSAAETRAALEIARAWRYASDATIEPVLATLDRVIVMLFRLCR